MTGVGTDRKLGTDGEAGRGDGVEGKNEEGKDGDGGGLLSVFVRLVCLLPTSSRQ